MRELKYYVAVTVDGYIAHEDGSFDGFPWDDELVNDFVASYEWFDTVLMGRKTYDVGLAAGKTSPYPMMEQIVFSRTMGESPDENVRLVSEGAVDVVRGLKEKPGKDIWLCGGADLAAQLFNAGLVDGLILKLNPVLFGSGIALFGDVVRQTDLELTESKIYPSGIAVLHYRVRPHG